MAKKFTFKGRSIEEMQAMSLEDVAKLFDARSRRALSHGLTKSEKKLLEDIRRKEAKLVKTHCRDMVIIPEMVGIKIGIYTGKEFLPVDIKLEMLGHRLGEFAMTRQKVKHSSPGIGATKSSKAVALK